MGATRLILLRHGRTEWNATGRFQGQADIPLDDLGRQQATLAREALADIDFAEAWSSDLSRAYETARTVVEPHGLEVRTDVRLREIHVGTWEGLTADEVAQVDPDLAAQLRQRHDARRSATGENTAEVGQRVAAALAEIADQADDGATVLIGIHGLAAASGALCLVGFAPEELLRFAGMTNCHWIDVRRTALGWRIHAWNVGPDGLVDAELKVVRPTEMALTGASITPA